ncbi:MAG: hypothetical protein ACRDP1_17055 [Nocardioidaceae bacterium]
MTATDRLIERIVGSYPHGWRDRYGDEVIQLALDLRHDGDRRRSSLVLDLARGSLKAWLFDRRTPMDNPTLRATSAVLWAWVAFATTAAWFGKNAGETPTKGAYNTMVSAHPFVGVLWTVLAVVGAVGIAVTVLVATPFAVIAARQARTDHRRGTLARMAAPPVIGVGWLVVLYALAHSSLHGSGGRLLEVGWLLLGPVGIVVATGLVVRVLRDTDLPAGTLRLGVLAAWSMTGVMGLGTAITLTWGLTADLTDPGYFRGGGVIGSWIVILAVMAGTTVVAMQSLRRLEPQS